MMAIATIRASINTGIATAIAGITVLTSPIDKAHYKIFITHSANLKVAHEDDTVMHLVT